MEYIMYCLIAIIILCARFLSFEKRSSRCFACPINDDKKEIAGPITECKIGEFSFGEDNNTTKF